jgi:predicted hydrocarbon binding protein
VETAFLQWYAADSTITLCNNWVKVYHSPFADAYGLSSSSVCHFIRGVLGVMASIVFGREIKAKELACLSKDDKYCRFKII